MCIWTRRTGRRSHGSYTQRPMRPRPASISRSPREGLTVRTNKAHKSSCSHKSEQERESMSREQLARFLLLSWHPMVELEQLTETSTKDALDYWQKMLSFFERRKRLQPGPFDSPSAMDTPELARLRVLEEKAFGRRLEDLRRGMKEKVGEEGRVEDCKF